MVWLGWVVDILFWLTLDLWVFFYLYVALMNIVEAHEKGRMKIWTYVLCAPIVVLALLIDFLHNVTVFMLLYCEFPKAWLVTHRLQRHVKDTHGWRGRLSRWLCSTLLSPFDHTGDHCD